MKFVTLILGLVLSSQAYGWGATGHRIVGEIAQQNLSTKGKRFVKKYLGSEKLAHAALWADEIKSDPSKSKELAARWSDKPEVSISYWHFTSIPAGKTYAESPKSPNGDIVVAMRKMDSVLRDKTAPYLHKKEALRLLAHYVGDIHQPLHAGAKEDRGGNYCWVKFFPQKPANIVEPKAIETPNYVNLHSMWDSKMIDSSNLTFEEYATKLNRPSALTLSGAQRDLERQFDGLTPKELRKVSRVILRKWMKTDYEQMADESAGLRGRVYPKSNDENNPTATPFCFASRSTQIKAELIPRVSYSQRDKFYRILDWRLYQAGIRLAHSINQIAAGKPLSR